MGPNNKNMYDVYLDCWVTGMHIDDAMKKFCEEAKEPVQHPKGDAINHPDHYKSKSGLETIDVIKAFTEDLDGVLAVDTGNIIKYICRWHKKNGLEDLKKARWYLNHLIEEVER